MRLRYIHLPRCGPLHDAAIVFGREDQITETLNLPRKGSLNFIVGINGSGKSSLLRVAYQAFRSLNVRNWPAQPMTLAWDRSEGEKTVTTILHFTNIKEATSYFATLKKVPSETKRPKWESIIDALGNDESHPLVESLHIATGTDAISNPLLFARLPKRLIAYTSGAEDMWQQLDQPIFHPKNEEEGLYRTEDERPRGWSMDQEWEEEQPVRISNLLTRYALKSSGKAQSLSGSGQIGELTNDTIERLRQELGPLENIRQKVFMNRMPRTERLNDSYFRVSPRHLRYAGIILALWQSAKELAGRNEERQREAFRNDLIHQQASDEMPEDARRVLNEIDWFCPTHLSITYRDADDRVSPLQHQELLCLVALADEVIAQPRGRMRAVFSLGPSDNISLTEKLKDAFPYGVPGKVIEFIAERVDGSKTMAEAILKVFSEADNIDSTPLDVFTRLRDWERTGLLEDISLTIKRLHRPSAPDQEPDDTIVAYDQLSDGEQMLLGRMGLIFLLRGQDGSLLLMDEPETHFNDVWKREIVEMIDMGLLNSTEANVIVATHTSIALTDAFAAEVTVLDKVKGHINPRSVAGGLFGTDPGEINMNLFRAEGSTGSRSVDILDKLLKTEWKDREEELKAVLDILGSSFHRAELRAVLRKLQTNSDGTSSP